MVIFISKNIDCRRSSDFVPKKSIDLIIVIKRKKIPIKLLVSVFGVLLLVLY